MAKLGRRVIRLGIPVAAAAAIATGLLAVMPDAHRRAAVLTRSVWLGMDASGTHTLMHLAREVGVDSLLLGYRESTLFTSLAPQLPPMERSLDAPFWSLHLELYGSLLVLCLVWVRTRSARLHAAAVVICAVAFGTHPMFLFVLGHLLSSLLGLPSRKVTRGAGLLILFLGLTLSASKDWQAVEWLRIALIQTGLASAPNLFQFQSQLAAIALYVGVLVCPLLWPALQAGPMRHFGRLSFSIYLLHFPILFTLVCLGFTALPSVPVAFLAFLALTVPAAALFERFVDRPAIALSYRAGDQRRNSFTSVSA